MSVLNPLVRTVQHVKILLEATNVRVNVAMQTGTVRPVSCRVKLKIVVWYHYMVFIFLTGSYSKKAQLKVVSVILY